MNVRVQKLIVTIVTTDTNPASVCASVDAALSSLGKKQRVYLAGAECIGNDPVEREIPDEPYGGEPDNNREMREHDDWMNNHVYPLTGS